MPIQSRRSTIRSALVLGAALVAAVAVAPTALAATTATGLPATAHPATVTLVTGEQVTVVPEPNGRDQYLISHSSGGYHTYRDATGDGYVIPAEAQPYLGHGLDKSLFDVSALVRDKLASGAKLPVRLGFAAGATPVAPAGITLTSISGTSATGYLTPSSASAFAAALRAGIGADVTAGRPLGTTAPATGLTGLSLAAAGAPTRVTPFYPLYILQINVTDATGAPADNAEVLLADTDQLSKQLALVPVVNGIARIAVPAGDYSAIASFVDFDSDGNLTSERQLLVSDFTVQPGPDTTALNIAETGATLPVSVTTPRPSTEVGLVADLLRGDAAGNITGFSSVLFGAIPLYVNATSAPEVGIEYYQVAWTSAATKASDNYLYDVAFGSSSGVPADESFAVRPSQLATVHQRITADPRSGSTDGYLFDGATDPAGASGIGVIVGVPATMPGTLTHYFGTADSGEYNEQVQTPNQTFLTGSLATFAPRREYTQDWGHGPSTAGLGQYIGPTLCDACTSGGNLLVAFSLADDSDPSHSAQNDQLPTSESFALYQNGTLVFDQPYYVGATLSDIPDVPTKYEAVLEDDYTGITGVSQSQVTHTDVTFSYDPAADPGSDLPAADQCYADTSYPYGSACHILPILTANYQLAGLDQTNTSHSRAQLADINIGHVSYDGQGSHSQVRSAALAISWDNGATWRSVPLAGRNGHYLAAWPNPPAGSTAATTGPELKVTAADAAGNTITQTVNTAYTIGSTK